MHRGKKVEEVVRQSGVNISALARRIKRSTRAIYDWFEMERMSYDNILLVGKGLNYDFSKDFPDLREREPGKNVVKEPVVSYAIKKPETDQEWEALYIATLEKQVQDMAQFNKVVEGLGQKITEALKANNKELLDTMIKTIKLTAKR